MFGVLPRLILVVVIQALGSRYHTIEIAIVLSGGVVVEFNCLRGGKKEEWWLGPDHYTDQ